MSDEQVPQSTDSLESKASPSNLPRKSTRSNTSTRVVQVFLLLVAIAWAFIISKQDFGQTQIPGFLIALAISWALTPVVRSIALKKNLLDQPVPGSRHIHTTAVPRLGGVAIYVAVITAIGMLILICGRFPHLARGSEGGFIGMLIGGTLIFALGLMDDFNSINAKAKLAVQALASCAAYSMGVRIKAIPIPENLGAFLHLAPHAHSIELGPIFGMCFTVFWLVAIVNAVNLIDGMDGLAAGVSAISALTIWSVALGDSMDRQYAALMAAVLAGALLGFLRWNFNPARIFLGDSGAYLTGFILGALSITGVIKGEATETLSMPTLLIALIILFFPLLDTSWAIVRRLAKGVSPFTPDAGHIHHRLLGLGLSPKNVAYRIYGCTAVLGLVAAWLVNQQIYYLSLVAAVLLLAVFFATVLNRRGQLSGSIIEGEVPFVAGIDRVTDADADSKS